MEIGLGVLQYPPDAFWSCSLNELYAAIDGLNAYNGGDQNAPLTREEFEELRELRGS